MWRKKLNKYSDERALNVVRCSLTVQTCAACKKIIYVVSARAS